MRFDEAVLRDDLIGQIGIRDGSGRPDALIFEAEGWCLKTSPRRWYADADEARAALAHLARAKVSLGPMLLEDTVLVLSRGDEGKTWMWTIAPWVPSLRSTMAAAEASNDERALGDALAAFARATVSSLVLALQRGVVVDVHPSNFARHRGEIVYIDDDVTAGTHIPSVGHAMLQRVKEYPEAPGALRRYLDALEHEMITRLTHRNTTELRLAPLLEGERGLTESAEGARRRMLEMVGRCPSALAS